MNFCQIKLSNCQKEGYKKVNGKWHCGNCLDEIWATLQAIQSFREDQKSDTLKIPKDEFEKRVNKNLIRLKAN